MNYSWEKDPYHHCLHCKYYIGTIYAGQCFVPCEIDDSKPVPVFPWQFCEMHETRIYQEVQS